MYKESMTVNKNRFRNVPAEIAENALLCLRAPLARSHRLMRSAYRIYHALFTLNISILVSRSKELLIFSESNLTFSSRGRGKQFSFRVKGILDAVKTKIPIKS